MRGSDLHSKTAIKSLTYNFAVEWTYVNSSAAFYSGSMNVYVLDDRTRNVPDNSTVIFNDRDLVCMACTKHACYVFFYTIVGYRKPSFLFWRKKDD